MKDFDRSLPYYVHLKDESRCLVVDRDEQSGELIGFPKLVAGEDGNLEKPFTDYGDWFKGTGLKLDVSRYIKPSLRFGESVFSFPRDDVQALIHPIDHSPNALVSSVVSTIAGVCNIAENQIGLEGSRLLGTEKGNSDIDLVVYGYEEGQLIKHNFGDLRSAEGISLLDPEVDADEIYEKRRKLGFGGTKAAIVQQQARRFYGVAQGTPFSLINSLGSNEYIPGLNKRNMTSLGYISGEVLRIVDDEFGVYTPSLYVAESVSTGQGFDIEVWNHYGINQAQKGEIVEVSGGVYQNSAASRPSIVLSFWSSYKDQFNLLETDK